MGETEAQRIWMICLKSCNQCWSLKKTHWIPWIPNDFQANTWSPFCSPGKANVKEGNKSLPFPDTFLPCPRSCITKLPCSLLTSEPKSHPCSISWSLGDQPLSRLSGGTQRKVWILAPGSYQWFQEEHRRHSVRLALHLNGLLFFSVISTDCSSGLHILCGFSPVEPGAMVIKSVFKKAVDWMWLFQWTSESQHLLVSWCRQLHFSGRTLWLACILFMWASHDDTVLIIEKRLPWARSSKIPFSALYELGIVAFIWFNSLSLRQWAIIGPIWLMNQVRLTKIKFPPKIQISGGGERKWKSLFSNILAMNPFLKESFYVETQFFGPIKLAAIISEVLTYYTYFATNKWKNPGTVLMKLTCGFADLRW